MTKTAPTTHTNEAQNGTDPAGLRTVYGVDAVQRTLINGTSLAYTDHGGGEPVVLVHGSASDYRTWDAHRESLATRFRVITYSRRYHWPNEPIGEAADYSMTEHVDDLEALLQSLGAAPAHLVGHSYGGFLSLLLAIRHPERVRSLVLAEPPVVPLFVSNVPRPPELLKLLVGRPRTAIAVMKFGAAGIAPATKAAKRGDIHTGMRIFANAVLGPDSYRRLSPARLEQARGNTFKAEFLGSGFAPLTDDQVRRVRVPSLLLTGAQSPKLWHRLTDRLEELLPSAERVEIPGASHIMHEDNAPAYREAVLGFLARHTR
jgi:pimeloyl-ACP methyl ester carboxylesterase